MEASGLAGVLCLGHDVQWEVPYEAEDDVMGAHLYLCCRTLLRFRMLSFLYACIAWVGEMIICTGGGLGVQQV